MSWETHRLTRAIVDGDEAAFREFYDLYSGRVFRLLLVLSSGQEDVARELHQIVMIKVARKPRVFQAEPELWAWLTQVARHAFVDHVRRLARRAERRLPEMPRESALSPPDAREHAFLTWLDQGLQSLKDDERQLVEAVYFDGRTQKDVALANGQTVKAVESKLARIRSKLRQFILSRNRHER